METAVIWGMSAYAVRLSRMSTLTPIRMIASAFLVLAAALTTSDARGQFYVGAQGGWTSLPDQTDTIPGVTSATATFNNGFNAGVRGGYEWGPLSFEEEYSYRQNDTHNLAGPGFAINGVSGNRHTNSLMTNVLFDFTVGWPVTPHVGFGVGAVEVFDGLKLPGIGQLFNNSSWQFGYQGIAGIRYNLNQSLTLDLDYRFLAATEPTFKISKTMLIYNSDYYTHNFVASLIYRFAPPTPPAPVPAAAPVPLSRTAQPCPSPQTPRTMLVSADH
jgi:OOP family OmpA-OmpF porin